MTGYRGGSDCDLACIFRRLERGIPTVEEREFLFKQHSFPRLKTQLVTDGLLITKGLCDYGRDYRVERLHFQAHKKTYRYLGLLILSVVFRGLRRVSLNLAHPKSDVRQLIIESDWANSSSNLQFRPKKFSYRPEPAKKHPWYPWESNGISVWDLPRFNLSNRKGGSITEDDWKNRDTVYGLGNDRAALMFAEMLLNIGRPQSRLNEAVLESERGYRGVGPASVEVSLHLPGGFGWFAEWWKNKRATVSEPAMNIFPKTSGTKSYVAASVSKKSNIELVN